MRQASALLRSSTGGFKSFEQFYRDVKKIDNTYNRSYLAAEYEYAVQSTQMAVKWKDWEEDGDRYLLQYRTAGDERVREEHAALNNTTLPMDDKFWDSYLPPLGWRCRCTVVQVRKGKYPVSDSDAACSVGEHATSLPKQKIFRFNPGKTGKVFPPKHPYLPKGCGNCSRKLLLSYNPKSEKCRSCTNISHLAIIEGRKWAEESMPLSNTKVKFENILTKNLLKSKKTRNRLLRHCFTTEELEAAIYFWNNPHLLRNPRISVLGENKDMSDRKAQKNIAAKKSRGVCEYIEYCGIYRGIKWLIKTEHHKAGFEQFYCLKKGN